MNLLFETKPTLPWIYFLMALLGSLIVRLINTCIRVRETNTRRKGLFCAIFLGRGYQEDLTKPPIAADHCIGYWLGLLELLAYPILLRSENATYIGAWLAFKTVHRWGYAPNRERGSFNRYLFANALILCISYLMALLLVDP